MDEKKAMLLRGWRAGAAIDERVLRAFERVKREQFIMAQHSQYAYADAPLPLPAGQTISQPSTVMLMSQALDVREGMSVLEIGAGSGYQAAILCELVGKTGRVYSIETIPELVSLAQHNLRKAGYSRSVTVSFGDGSQGFAAHAPYERIIVTAGAPSVPKPLLEQLKDGGIMVIPVDDGTGSQTMWRISRRGGKYEQQAIGEFVFVPLTGKYGKNP